MAVFFKKQFFKDLFEKGTESKKQRKTGIFHPLLHFPVPATTEFRPDESQDRGSQSGSPT